MTRDQIVPTLDTVLTALEHSIANSGNNQEKSALKYAREHVFLAIEKTLAANYALDRVRQEQQRELDNLNF